MYYLWFTNSFVYYGLTLNSGSLIPGDLHINFVIGGALEILAYILTILAFLYAGRRISMSVSMLIGGVALLLGGEGRLPAVPLPDRPGDRLCHPHLHDASRDAVRQHPGLPVIRLLGVGFEKGIETRILGCQPGRQSQRQHGGDRRFWG